MSLLVSCLAFMVFNGQVLVPIDHQIPGSKKIAIQYSFENNFEEGRETVFLVDDPLKDVSHSLDPILVLEGNWNVVRIHGRHHSADIKKMLLERDNLSWKEAYRFYNQHQVAHDIEYVRKKLLGDQKVILLGHSSSAAGLLYYISIFPEKVSRSILMSPLLFDVQENLRFSTEILPLVDFGFKIDAELLFDYAIRSGLNFVQFEEDERYTFFLSSLLFSYFQFGLQNRILKVDDVAKKVRIFEHFFAFGFKENLKHPIAEWMREVSSGLWLAYKKSPFPIHGTYYDQVWRNQGNILILGGKYDLLVNYHSYEVLAEFFPNSTLVIINEGHSLNKLYSSGLMARLLNAFLENSVVEKIRVFEEMRKLSLLSK